MKKKRKITKKQMIAMKKQKPLPVSYRQTPYFSIPTCPDCGCSVEDEDNYCKHCGQRLYLEFDEIYAKAKNGAAIAKGTMAKEWFINPWNNSYL